MSRPFERDRPPARATTEHWMRYGDPISPPAPSGNRDSGHKSMLMEALMMLKGTASHFSKLISIQMGDGDRFGNVRGIEIDLRHELLDRHKWRSQIIGILPYPVGRDPAVPFIWFPWFGDFNANVFRRLAINKFLSKSKCQSGAKEAKIAHFNIERFVRLNTSDCFVTPGDKIYIDSVEMISTGDRFDHPDNAELRRAYLRVDRAGEKPQILRTPMTFIGYMNLTNNTLCDHSLMISKHILDYYGLTDLDEFKSIPKDTSHAYRALSQAYHLLRELGPIRKVLYSGVDVFSKAFQDAHAILALVNNASLMSYSWGKAEGDAKLKPILEVELSKSSTGGKNNAKKRWANKQPIIILVRNEAQALWAKNHSYSQNDIAVSIQGRWKEVVGPAVETPVVSTIIKYIKGMVSPAKVERRVGKKEVSARSSSSKQ